MPQFDPVSWFKGVISEKTIFRMIRLCMTLLCVVFLIRRIMEYHLYYFKPLWLIETLIYIVFISAFLTRTDPKVRSRGFREIVIPLFGSGFPFLLLFTTPSEWIIGDHLLLVGTFGVMTATTVITVWALSYLRRSFSLTAEVRDLVTGGPYRWIRHPMYLGEILTAAVVTFWRFSLLNLILYITFVGIQLFRANMEERKLYRHLGKEYEEFASSRWWFLRAKYPSEN